MALSLYVLRNRRGSRFSHARLGLVMFYHLSASASIASLRFFAAHVVCFKSKSFLDLLMLPLFPPTAALYPNRRMPAVVDAIYTLQHQTPINGHNDDDIVRRTTSPAACGGSKTPP